MSIIRYSGALERCAVVILLSLTSTLTQAASTTASTVLGEVAQGCYAIYAPDAKRYLSYDSKSELNDGYQFKNVAHKNAMPLFFKRVAGNKFRIRDTLGNDLDFSSATQGDTAYPWSVEASPASNTAGSSLNQWRFRFTSTSGSQTLALNSDGRLTLNSDYAEENQFRLVEAARCNPYNEVFPNVVGNRNNLKGHASNPVRGWMDAHTHISSFMAFGGTVLHGKPFDERGPAYALEDSLWTHGPSGAFDFVGRFLTGDILAKRNTEGWPNFPEWPNHKDRTYSLYYYTWLERSYLSGQRLMVVHLVENEVLCYADLVLSIFGEKTLCNPRTSIKAQAKYMHKLEDYIDEQFGGPGKGFLRIVGSPAEARRVIAQGKMAIVLGVEASELFNCGLSDLFEGVLAGTSLSDANFKCDLNDVDRELDALYDLGVRSIFPIHRFDNKFGGTYVDDGIFSLANAMSTGHLFKTEACDAGTLGADINGIPLIGGSSKSFNLQAIFNALGLKINAKLLDYDPDINHCNRRGLSPLGVYLVNRMIDKKMLIEVDHASVKALRKMLDIAEARQYSGVVTSHSWTHVKPDYGLHNEVERLLNMGGFAAPYHSSTTKSYEPYDGGSLYIDASINRYLDVIKTTPYLQGVGLGSDISGLGKQVGPRAESDTDPLRYPYTNEFGLTFNRQQTGNRVFDLNIDGMVHYGMMPDNIQDIRMRGDQGVYDAIMNSAEAYLQMWERATASTNTAYADTADPFFKIVNRQTNLCVDITDHDLNVTSGTEVTTYACEEASFDQDWVYDPKLMQVQNRVDRSICLDNGGNPKHNKKVLLGKCKDHSVFAGSTTAHNWPILTTRATSHP
jgi:microsomal dipeptidase-like Zn-dependent dipeptidase